MDQEGFVKISDILALSRFSKYTLENVMTIIDKDEKSRYFVKEENGVFYIRANQGHTIKLERLHLTPIKSRDELPGEKLVLHGTYKKAWQLIKHQGLSKMKRNHVHFTVSTPNSDTIISGVRHNVEVLIYVDIDKAIADGIEFFLSHNNVVLTEGKDGYVSPKYFEYVVDADFKPFDKKYPLEPKKSK